MMRASQGWELEAELTQSEDAPDTGGETQHDAALAVLQGRRGGLVDVSLEEAAGQGDGQGASHHLAPGSQLVGRFARAVEDTGEQHHQHPGSLGMQVVAVRLQGGLHQQLLQDSDEGGQQAVPTVLLSSHVELPHHILETQILTF